MLAAAAWRWPQRGIGSAERVSGTQICTTNRYLCKTRHVVPLWRLLSSLLSQHCLRFWPRGSRTKNNAPLHRAAHCTNWLCIRTCNTDKKMKKHRQHEENTYTSLRRSAPPPIIAHVQRDNTIDSLTVLALPIHLTKHFRETEENLC